MKTIPATFAQTNYAKLRINGLLFEKDRIIRVKGKK
jgi:hypothetical protein